MGTLNQKAFEITDVYVLIIPIINSLKSFLESKIV